MAAASTRGPASRRKPPSRALEGVRETTVRARPDIPARRRVTLAVLGSSISSLSSSSLSAAAACTKQTNSACEICIPSSAGEGVGGASFLEAALPRGCSWMADSNRQAGGDQRGHSSEPSFWSRVTSSSTANAPRETNNTSQLSPQSAAASGNFVCAQPGRARSRCSVAFPAKKEKPPSRVPSAAESSPSRRSACSSTNSISAAGLMLFRRTASDLEAPRALHASASFAPGRETESRAVAARAAAIALLTASPTNAAVVAAQPTINR
mmetsp:Transcript_18584/g.47483  ORF Transcript_18584/g.47483 Transcript_18584/m.47483 type:complete len:267 (+) Transcript_18584:540-1340(+)